MLIQFFYYNISLILLVYILYREVIPLFLAIIILAISVSIDALGIGVTYGLRNTSITKSADIILFLTSLVFAGISIFVGNVLSFILPENIIKFISVFILICMGFWIIYETLRPEVKEKECVEKGCAEKKCKEKKCKVHQIFLKPFGITIQIIKNPIASDLNNSKSIEINEALYLAIALSIDSICVGISSVSFGNYSLLFPLFVPIFQLLFLNTGIKLGKRIVVSSSISNKIWNILSGMLLIVIGIIRAF